MLNILEINENNIENVMAMHRHDARSQKAVDLCTD